MKGGQGELAGVKRQVAGGRWQVAGGSLTWPSGSFFPLAFIWATAEGGIMPCTTDTPTCPGVRCQVIG